MGFIQSTNNAVQICGPETGHVVSNIAFCDTPARAALFVQCLRIAEANSGLAASILALLDGKNFAAMSAERRGALLNSIRDLAKASQI